MKAKIKAKWKDILVRAGKTAIQTFLGSFPITLSTFEGGKIVWMPLLISAASAGISAGMNVIIAALSDDYL